MVISLPPMNSINNIQTIFWFHSEKHHKMSNFEEVAELIWENGQLSMHGLGGLQSTSQEKPITSRAHDTLDSIVQQATIKRCQPLKFTRQGHAPASNSINSIDAPSSSSTRKRTWSNANVNVFGECDILSDCGCGCGCASAGATFCRDNDATMITWASLESGRSFKTMEEDSACHCGSEIRDNQDDRDSKAEKGQINSKRRSRTAAIHNLSERVIKSASSTDPNDEYEKHAPNDGAIGYATAASDVNASQNGWWAWNGNGSGEHGSPNRWPSPSPRSFPQLIQQTTTVGTPAGTAPLFVAPSFMMPSMIQPHAPNPQPASMPLPHPYSTSLNQAINMDILNNMAALYQHQMSQNNHNLSSSISQPHHEHILSKVIEDINPTTLWF
ncbi:hypothetical protein Fmac_008662 [Flemingia macrophylla]|uniref:Uncharacterized protein n=1 Tax=Flemingia macrophylla TaxID=520843 RepID=A0ABD1MY04_9FABA